MGKHSKQSHLRRRASVATAAAAVGVSSLLLGGPSAMAAPGPTPAPTGGPAGPAAAQLVDGTPCTVTAKACVDLPSRQAWLINNGQVVDGPVPIMPGAPDEPTPVGTFVVQWKDKHHVSNEFNNAPMPNSVFFADGGIAFHEGSLQRYSAGCIHLSREASLAFFDTLQIGAEVQVH